MNRSATVRAAIAFLALVPILLLAVSFGLSLGAGIYEELVFRLFGLTVLHTLLFNVLKMKKGTGYLAMVVISSLGFAFYHYLGDEQFSWRSLVFRTVAGAYFAGLFLTRGFGITAFSHSSYDIIVSYLRLAGGV